MQPEDATGDPTTIGLHDVGSPIELFRVTEPVYAEQALYDWEGYIRRTLGASMAAGGRFNPRCEFGAVYTSTDERTAWEETAARMRREGVPGLHPDLRLLRIVVLAGEYVGLDEHGIPGEWGMTAAVLTAPDPTEHDVALCWNAARAIRAVADFLESPSARGTGRNVPLFPDRYAAGLRADLAAVERGRVPSHLLQRATEAW